MRQDPYDDPTVSRRLEAPEERQEELLETDELDTLADVVDAHSDRRYDMDVTTAGMDPALLQTPDPVESAVGYAGNYSNDGMSGHRVDDALMPDFDEPGSMMAGEYGPEDSDLESDMIDNIHGPHPQSRDAHVDNSPESLSLNEQEVLSSGVGHVRTGASLPLGYQIENVSMPGEAPELINEPDEGDFLSVDEATGAATAASRKGMAHSEDDDDQHTNDVVEGT